MIRNCTRIINHHDRRRSTSIVVNMLLFVHWTQNIMIDIWNKFITKRDSQVNFMIMKDLINQSKQKVQREIWLFEKYFYHNVKFLNIISTSDWIFLSIIKFMQSCNYIFPLKEDLGKVWRCKTIFSLNIEINHLYDFY